MLAVKKGDIVFHLCGNSGKAAFTGFSIADEDGQAVNQGPSGLREIYRVTLRDFIPFEEKKLWNSVRSEQHEALLEYFNTNKQKKPKLPLFYVKQSNRLQCLNGAYLSFLDDQLTNILFGFHTINSEPEIIVKSAAQVGTVLAKAAIRVGQQRFAENVKRNFGHSCCFPGCAVSDPRFLVGAHIARWTDVLELRGLTENGLCLCVFHDRAFEVGAFTFDHELNVKLGKCNPNEEWVKQLLTYGLGKHIKPSKILPAPKTLAYHWLRHKIQ